MHTLTMTEQFPAPVDRVFGAWSSANEVSRWFAPGEMHVPEAEVDCDEIDQILESYRAQSRWTQSGFEGVITSREHLLSQSGLLLPRSSQMRATKDCMA